MKYYDELPPERPFAELFRDLLTGDLNATDAEAERFFREYPGLDELWAEHCETAKLLDAGGFIERETLREVVRSAPVPGEELVADIISNLRPRPNQPIAQPRAVPLAWLWVAGGLVALFLAVRLLGGSDSTKSLRPNDLLFLDSQRGRPVGIRPSGDIQPDALELFAWRFDPAEFSDHFFRVVVFDSADQEIVRSVAIRTAEPDGEWDWRPLSSDVERIAEEEQFHWQIELWQGEQSTKSSDLLEARIVR